MAKETRDARQELADIIAELQSEADSLRRDRARIDAKLKDVDEKINVVRAAFAITSERHGEPIMPLFTEKGQPSRFVGMKVGDALKILKKENPKITKEQAYKILVKEKFDFRDKRPKTAVHFAWIALERSKKWRQK